jgi:hypothetical protein
MPLRKDSPHLKYDPILPNSMDYYFLRKEGVRYAQELSGAIWTDFNLHDPGVTILEQCCFALTNIAFQTSRSFEKLLFRDGDQAAIAASNCLFDPEEILLSPTCTLDDYKIMCLDKIENISNIWFNTCTDFPINGLYDVYVQPYVHSGTAVDTVSEEEIERDIRVFFSENRNLCEDIHRVVVLKAENIAFEVHVDLYQEGVVEEVIAEMLFQLDSYFNPKIKYTSIETLLSEEKTYDVIFDRPSFNKNKGFIESRSFDEYQHTFSFFRIQSIITSVPGVRNARELIFKKDGIKVGSDQLTIDDDTFISIADLIEKSMIYVTKNNVRLNYSKDKVKTIFFIKSAAANQKYSFNESLYLKKAKVATEEIDAPYSSIQNTFPATYGIGAYGLPNEDNHRLLYARQLQAYLLFFDQILLNHQGQLKNIKNVFSIDPGQDKKTYFAQIPDTVPAIQELVNCTIASDDFFWSTPGINVNFFDRKNRVLDHLLARFAETFVDESHYNLKTIFGLSTSDAINEVLVDLKYKFLKQYPKLSKNKNKGYDYFKSTWAGKPLGHVPANTASADVENNYTFKTKLFLLLNIRLENQSFDSLVDTDNKFPRTVITEKERKDMVQVHSCKNDLQQEYYKTYAQPSTDQVKFVLPESQEAREQLYYNGAKRDSYVLSEDMEAAGKQILFFKSTNTSLPLALGEYDTANEAQRIIDTLVQKFTDITKKSEGFHVVEHILLRPMLGEQFHLCLTIDQTLSFQSVISDTYEQNKSKLLDCVLLGTDRKSFSITEHSGKKDTQEKKYILQLTDAFGNTVLHSLTTYESIEQAQSVIDTIVIPFFKEIGADRSIIPSSVEIKPVSRIGGAFGKNPDKPLDHLIDSTSNEFYNAQISLVLPNWLPRFNEPDFRTLLTHSLAQCLPAHISVNLHWVSTKRMLEFEGIYHKWIMFKASCLNKELDSLESGKEQNLKQAQEEYLKKALALDTCSQELIYWLQAKKK